jgi:2-polyprenyl-6-methoxyphenol hydroxylase-like FAD-dependent oxidoreductase
LRGAGNAKLCLVTEVADAELLIVGAGPCGLVAAITAARYGTEVVCVEQRAGGSSLFRALVLSTRGMELMRRIGLEAAVRAGAADVEPTALVTFTLASPEGNIMPLGYPSDVEAVEASPCRPAWAPSRTTNRSWPAKCERSRPRRCGWELD